MGVNFENEHPRILPLTFSFCAWPFLWACVLQFHPYLSTQSTSYPVHQLVKIRTSSCRQADFPLMEEAQFSWHQ